MLGILKVLVAKDLKYSLLLKYLPAKASTTDL
jgi:hypothetical protein